MNLLRSSPTSSFLASLFCLLLAICIASDRCIAQSGDSGRFGIRAYSSSVEVMLDGRLRSIPGKQISAVQSGGVADDAGVLVGDVIVKWDGSYVDGSLPFEILLRRSYGRGRVPFKVVRNATFISLTAEFGTAHEMVRHSRTSPGTTFGQENETTRLEREATRQSKVPAPLPYVGECVSGYKDVPFGAYLDEAKKLLLQANVCIDFSENGRILRPQSNDVIYCEPGYVLNGKQRRTKLYFSEGRVQRIELMMVEDGGGVDLDPYEALVALLTKKYGPAKMSENAIGETTWLFCNGEVALARTFPHLQIKAKKKLAMTKLGMNSAQIAKFDPAAGTEVKKVEQEIGQMIELQMMSDYPQLLGYEESFESWLLQYSCPAMAKENLDTHNARKKAEGEHEAHQKELEAISKQKTTSDDL